MIEEIWGKCQYLEDRGHSFEELSHSDIFWSRMNPNRINGKSLISFTTDNYQAKISEVKITGVKPPILFITLDLKFFQVSNPIKAKVNDLSFDNGHGNNDGTSYQLFFKKHYTNRYQCNDEGFNRAYTLSSSRESSEAPFITEYLPHLINLLIKVGNSSRYTKVILTVIDRRLSILIFESSIYNYSNKVSIKYHKIKERTERMFLDLKVEFDHMGENGFVSRKEINTTHLHLNNDMPFLL